MQNGRIQAAGVIFIPYTETQPISPKKHNNF